MLEIRARSDGMLALARPEKSPPTEARSRTAMTPPIRELESFRMLGEVGSGAHGTVQRAEVTHPIFGLQPGDAVAVKFLRSDLIDDAVFEARFRTEAEIGSRIEHPNVVRIHGLIDSEVLGLRVLAIVMEFVHGSNLHDVMQKRGAPLEAFLRRAGADAAAGLAALHAEQIVHRDIKPENLYIADDGSTKIVDLGLAYRDLSEARKRSGALAGTLSYAAPELLRGRTASPGSDLWALGLVLH